MAKNAIKLTNMLTVNNEETTTTKRGFVLEGFCAGQSSNGPGCVAEKYLHQKDFTKDDLYLNIEEIPSIKAVQRGSEGEGVDERLRTESVLEFLSRMEAKATKHVPFARIYLLKIW